MSRLTRAPYAAFTQCMTKSYDAFLYLDTSRAVHAVETEYVDTTEMPDLYPWGV